MYTIKQSLVEEITGAGTGARRCLPTDGTGAGAGAAPKVTRSENCQSDRGQEAPFRAFIDEL